MLPYHGFVKGRFDDHKIELQFAESLVVIQGQRLGELWLALQLQDVRRVCLTSEACDPFECEVEKIEIRLGAELDPF